MNPNSGKAAEQPRPDGGRNGSKIMRYFKTLGIAGFLFFLIKGLVWLAIFWGIGKSC
ncbi:MAG: hypothetical protein U0V54_04455 [Saprospiraceae bacterium]|nr:hypothetical protein [Saprospiraceae bacterium]